MLAIIFFASIFLLVNWVKSQRPSPDTLFAQSSLLPWLNSVSAENAEFFGDTSVQEGKYLRRCLSEPNATV